MIGQKDFYHAKKLKALLMFSNLFVQKFQFPAGEYYIGDPCYAVADNDWMPLLEKTGYFGLYPADTTDFEDGLFYYKGERCFTHNTAYGDGEYRGSDGNYYPVDAGLIGIMPIHLVDKSLYDLELDSFSTVFKKDFNVWEENGIFHFGHIRINTR